MRIKLRTSQIMCYAFETVHAHVCPSSSRVCDIIGWVRRNQTMIASPKKTRRTRRGSSAFLAEPSSRRGRDRPTGLPTDRQ